MESRLASFLFFPAGQIIFMQMLAWLDFAKKGLFLQHIIFHYVIEFATGYYGTHEGTTCTVCTVTRSTLVKLKVQNFKIHRIGPDGRKLDDMPGRHNMDYTIKTHLQREPATTMLKVNKLKLSNAGTYTVRVTNGVQTKEEKFSKRDRRRT